MAKVWKDRKCKNCAVEWTANFCTYQGSHYCSQCIVQERLKRSIERKKFRLENAFLFRCMGAKKRAEKKGFAYEIDVDILKAKFEAQDGRCFYSGIPFDMEGNDRRFSLSIERVDNSLGYIESNVVLVCTVVNSMKNNLTLAEFKEIVGKLHAIL
jgi:hypothetical protein